MSETDYDSPLIAAALRMAAERGWRTVTVAAAAREAGLPLGEARRRFPSRASILLRFGELADQAALQDLAAEGTARDRLFDLLMRRFDALQAHREGIRAVLGALPTDPALAVALACATRRSMKWLLEAAGVDTAGARGELRVQGLVAVWLWGVRAWERDASEDLSGTMATVDSALQRAESAANWLHGASAAEPAAPPPVSEGAGELDPSDPAAEPATDAP